MKESNFIKKKAEQFKALKALLVPAWKYGRGYMLSTIFFNMLLEPIYTLFMVRYVQGVVDAFASGKPVEKVLLTVLFYQGGIALVSIIRHLMVSLYHSKAWPRFCYKLEGLVYHKAMETDYRFMDDAEYFDRYTWALQNYIGNVDNAVTFLENLCKNVGVILTLTTLIVTNDVFIILVSICILLISNFVTKKKSVVMQKISLDQQKNERREMYMDRICYLREAAADMRCTELPGKMDAMFEKNIRDSLAIVDKNKWKRLRWELLNDLTGLILQLVIGAYLCMRIHMGVITIGAFAGMLYASDALRQNITQLLGLDVSLNDLYLFYIHSKKFFAQKSQIEAPVRALEDPAPQPVPAGPMSLTLDRVNFHYPNTEFSLQDITMDIRPGEKIAIVGVNGAGKSTLVKLLLRLYDVDSGSITICGEDIKKFDVHQLRKRIGVAFQQQNVYALSLRDNMTLFGDASDDELLESLNAVGLDNLLAKTGGTLDTEVTREFSENGIMLSGGELQKLALARILLRDFSLLILDEPSSALDPLAEYELNKQIFNLGSSTTTIFISHRLTSARHADKIYLFEHGRILESGTHEELMQANGKYCEMFNKQAENYIS